MQSDRKSSRPAMPSAYPDMRRAFLAAAAEAGAAIRRYDHPLPGPDGGALSTDVALIGRPEARKLLIVLSGTHGVETGFGSAVQVAWLRRHIPWHLPADVAVLMVHAINPWGAAWNRRMTEGNVDLNRNFLDWSEPAPADRGYAALHPALHFTDLDGADRQRATAAYAAASQAAGGFDGLRSAVEAGQYTHPDGLFYGGDRPVWSNATLRAILADFAGTADHVICFDLHTGAGPYGYPALLTVAGAAHAGLEWGARIFGPALTPVLTGDGATTGTGIAATATGYVSEAVRTALPHALTLPLVVECGTLPGQTINALLQEDNWLHLYGEPSSETGAAIGQRLREAFVPPDPDWQAQVTGPALAYFDRALAALESANGDAPRHAAVAAPATADSVRPAIEVHDLHKSYGPLEVLKGVDLIARPGEVVSMIGSSGSGKSTFLRCINLLEQPASGRIVVDGEEIRMKRDRHGATVPADRRQVERIRARVGMVFQNFNLWPHMSVLENIIESPVHVLGESRASAIERAHALLDKVGLSDKHGQYPGQLSGGQQQRAAIARTLAMRPRVILLDEPTSALDPELVGEVLRVIRNLAEEGNTMILVTHEMQFAREVSHRIKFLHKGLVEEEGSPAQLFGNPRSERLRQFLARSG